MHPQYPQYILDNGTFYSVFGLGETDNLLFSNNIKGENRSLIPPSFQKENYHFILINILR